MDLLDKIGPCPRDTIRYLESPQNFDTEVQRALDKIKSVEDIINTFKESTSDANALPHALILLRRREEQNYHSISVQFKTRHIASKASTQMNILRWGDAQKLFHAAEHSPATRTLAGWTFEKLAMGYLSGSEIVKDPKQPVIGPFEQMRRIKSSAGFRFEHISGKPLTYVIQIFFVPAYTSSQAQTSADFQSRRMAQCSRPRLMITICHLLQITPPPSIL